MERMPAKSTPGWKPYPAKEKMVNEIVEKNHRVRTVEAIRKKAALAHWALTLPTQRLKHQI